MGGGGTYKTPFFIAGSTKACMRTVPMASKKLNCSGLTRPLTEGRRLSLCDEFVVPEGLLAVPRLKQLLDEEAVEGIAVDEKERRPAKGGARLGEVVLLRLRWWRVVLLYSRGMHGKSAP